MATIIIYNVDFILFQGFVSILFDFFTSDTWHGMLTDVRRVCACRTIEIVVSVHWAGTTTTMHHQDSERMTSPRAPPYLRYNNGIP